MEYYNCLALPEELERLVFKFKIKMEKQDHQKKFKICVKEINFYNEALYESIYDITSINYNMEEVDDIYNNAVTRDHPFFQEDSCGTKSWTMLLYIKPSNQY